MVRPKKSHNKNLPQHLMFDSSKGTYRFTLVNGVRKTLGKDKVQAIQIAVEYNRIMRPTVGLTVDQLIEASCESPLANGQSFASHVDRLLELIFKEEMPSKQLASTMRNDAERVKAYFAEVSSQDISLEHINGYLNQYHPDASPNVHNRKLGFLEKLINYAIDQSIMLDNPASRKMKKRKTKGKERQRLSFDAYKQIHAAAPLWLQTAMDLALQSTQARLEVSRIKYSIKKPKDGQCGCLWFDEPIDGIYGTLFIHRQKVEKKKPAMWPYRLVKY
ncbi:hypothetical protein [Shewanella putrefaciens]|uniref:hypothetical protein n=1 Tax=Shewanella putrefaciens TaxID=24 RepID=UPI000D205E86|nr:hypothetical protein [Shewanella putrefaciens]AVV81922.1 recombinase [Shewanella putrefaciens]